MAQLAMPDSSISTATKAGLVPLQGHTTCNRQHPGRAMVLCLRNYPPIQEIRMEHSAIASSGVS